MNAPLNPSTSAKAVVCSGGVALVLLGVLLLSAPACGAAADYTDVKVVSTPAPSSTQPLYTGNREPLLPSPFIKLPIGSITPKGWLRHQLELEAQGMTGRLAEISPWLKFEGSAWSDPKGEGQNGWEELPYWLKGYGDLGYVLNDPEIIKAARKWIDAVLGSQQADGWFGPIANKTGLEGKPDLWPHMVMCNVLQSFYEFTGDERMLPFLTKYFKWLSTQPDKNFGAGYWPRIRFGDNIETLYWLYNRTGEAWLLELAKRIHDNMEPWTTGVHNWHNVNLAQGFREPGVFYLQGREERFLRAAENNYQTIMGLYGQFPGGGFAGDENCRPGFTDPRQGFETCGIVEFMHSFEMLTKISGNPLWADRCEDIAVNSLPAALTPDWKGLHYLTCANQVQLDKENKSPAIQNGGTMFSYSPFERYRCCQHNVSHGWPYYAEELWLATADRGLCASLYAASEVTAKVGAGASVKVVEETDYPFGDTVTLKISAAQPVKFPLYLRIPRWCDGRLGEDQRQGGPVRRQAAQLCGAGARVEGRRHGEPAAADGGARPEVGKEPECRLGILWRADLLAEDWRAVAALRRNGCLAGDGGLPHHAVELWPGAQREEPGQVIQGGEAERRGVAGAAVHTGNRADRTSGPGKTDSRVEAGFARPGGQTAAQPGEIRPADRDGHADSHGRRPAAHHGVPGDRPGAGRAHLGRRQAAAGFGFSLLGKRHGGSADEPQQPKSSNDQSIPRFTWWDHRGTAEWVEYNFDKPRKVSAVEVYWFDDTGVGSCRVPQSWKVLCKQGGNWKPVEGASGYETKLDTYNRAAFTPTEALGLRIEAQLQPDFSGGILSLKIIE